MEEELVSIFQGVSRSRQTIPPRTMNGIRVIACLNSARNRSRHLFAIQIARATAFREVILVLRRVICAGVTNVIGSKYRE